MRRVRCGLAAASVVLACVCLGGCGGKPGVGAGPEAPAARAAAAPKSLQIDLDKAIAVKLPEIAKDLVPVSFKADDGKSGWVLRIPGNHPIATPAYADGLLFVGGGYGSHEFYAFNAVSGEKVWQIQCADDGPTAAVVEDGCVAFNTESCTLIVVEAKTGKLIWQEWLGDPLMSQPAVANGRIYIAYPGGHPRGVQKGELKPGGAGPANAGAAQQQVVPGKALPAGPSSAVGPAKGNGHRLLCADLKTGKHLWEQDISADVITAPVVDGDSVVFTCMNGTTFSLRGKDGSIAWSKESSGTSAPVVVEGQVVNTERRGTDDKVMEGLVRMDAAKGDAREKHLVAAAPAPYFRPGKAGSVGLSQAQQKAQDSAVGFGGGGIMASGQASSNLNVQSIAGGWAYQGSRAAYSQGRLMNAQSNRFNCVDAKTGGITWQATATGKSVDAATQAFLPPALGTKNLYVCSTTGHFLALSQGNGEASFMYKLAVNVAFQPCLAKGNMYAGTTDGKLVCLTTGTPDADGWYAWGGNARHNKK